MSQMVPFNDADVLKSRNVTRVFLLFWVRVSNVQLPSHLGESLNMRTF